MKEEIYEWIKTIITSFAIALIITTFALPTIVSGTSMYPTLDNHDVLLLSKLTYKLYKPSLGDIVVFEPAGEDKNFIKRVIGVEGDIVEFKSGKVFVNSIQLNEEYLWELDVVSEDIIVEVPKGKLFVLGDNRNNSKDSRNVNVGLVDEGIVIGKAYFRLFPFSRIGAVTSIK